MSIKHARMLILPALTQDKLIKNKRMKSRPPPPHPINSHNFFFCINYCFILILYKYIIILFCYRYLLRHKSNYYIPANGRNNFSASSSAIATAKILSPSIIYLRDIYIYIYIIYIYIHIFLKTVVDGWE